MKIIDLKGLRNTRDIGGYINKDGKKLVYNKFIRSCELSKTNKSTRKSLVEDYKIKTIIDFRTDVEQKKKPIPKLKGTSTVILPILEDVNLGVPRNLKQAYTLYKRITTTDITADTFLTEMYLNMAFSDYSTNKYREFFDILLTNPEGAILYNCTEGKDRTGVATMLLMFCLNFDKQTIINDYMVSKAFCDKKMMKYRKRCKMLCLRKRIVDFVGGIMATKEIFLNAILEKIEKDFLTIENFIKEKLHLNSNDLQKLQDLYLE